MSEELNKLSFQLFSLNKTMKTLDNEKKELIEKIKFKMMEEDMDFFNDSDGNTLKYITKKIESIDKEKLHLYLGDEKYFEFATIKESKVLMPYSYENKEMRSKMMKHVSNRK